MFIQLDLYDKLFITLIYSDHLVHLMVETITSVAVIIITIIIDIL